MAHELSRSLKRLTLAAVPRQATRGLAVASTSTAPAPKAAKTSKAVAAAAGRFTPDTKRTGVLARKAGMTCLWDSEGNRLPVTVLHLDKVQVISSTPRLDPKTSAITGYSVVVGCSERKPQSTPATLLGEFNKAGVDPKLRVAGFSVSPDASVPVGTVISAAHFVPGQTVDVKATTIGKGFQGVMKRHGFGGLRASHGVSISHRSHGSTGQHQDPGRVFPGKKMAGRMGGKFVTKQNLVVDRVDTILNVLYVRGAVPGPPGGFVRVTDALKGVGWAARERQKKGIEGLLPEGVTDLPMPAGDATLKWPAEISRGITR